MGGREASLYRTLGFCVRNPSVLRVTRRGCVELSPDYGPGRSDLQPFLAYCAIGGKLRRRALEDDAAVAHHIEAAGNLQRDGQLLLDQQDRRAAPRDLIEQRADLLDQLW